MQENCVAPANQPTLTEKIREIYTLANNLEQTCGYVNRKLLGDTPEVARSGQKEPACLTDALDSIYSVLNDAAAYLNRVTSEFD